MWFFFFFSAEEQGLLYHVAFHLCEKDYKLITIQYNIAYCVSWVPRLTLMDLQTHFGLTNLHLEWNSLVCRGLTVWETPFVAQCSRIYQLLFSRSVMSSSVWPHGLQHARFPCLSTSTLWKIVTLIRVCSNFLFAYLVIHSSGLIPQGQKISPC